MTCCQVNRFPTSCVKSACTPPRRTNTKTHHTCLHTDKSKCRLHIHMRKHTCNHMHTHARSLGSTGGSIASLRPIPSLAQWSPSVGPVDFPWRACGSCVLAGGGNRSHPVIAPVTPTDQNRYLERGRPWEWWNVFGSSLERRRINTFCEG